MTSERKRIQNEKQFEVWENTPLGGRIYRQTILGHHGWFAVYVKEVDSDELALNFRQEIYDEKNVLREIHEKFPIDKGHIKINDKNGE